jgi:hypothetical protein
MTKANGKRFRIVCRESDRVLAACLTACQCQVMQTENDEDPSASLVVAAHVSQVVALALMLQAALHSLPETHRPLNTQGVNLRGRGPTFRADLPRFSAAIHWCASGSPVPRSNPADPFRVVGVTLSDLTDLSRATSGGQILLTPEAAARFEHEKARGQALRSPPLCAPMKIAVPQLDHSAFSVVEVQGAVMGANGKAAPPSPERPTPIVYSVVANEFAARQFPKPLLPLTSSRRFGHGEGSGGTGGGPTAQGPPHYVPEDFEDDDY